MKRSSRIEKGWVRVTAANCQMIIAAGHGAIGGQAINRVLFEVSLRRHTLPHCLVGNDRYVGRGMAVGYINFNVIQGFPRLLCRLLVVLKHVATERLRS
jgi:hypothetical protein